MKSILIYFLIFISSGLLVAGCINPGIKPSSASSSPTNAASASIISQPQATVTIPKSIPTPELTLAPPSSPAPSSSLLSTLPSIPSSTLVSSPAPSFLPSPTITSLKSESPAEGMREIKFETIKRAMGRPNSSLGLYLGIQNNKLFMKQPFLWVINNYDKSLPLMDHIGSRDRRFIRQNVNFDTELLIVVFQGLTDGGWDHAIEIQRVWQEDNVINIEAKYKTLEPELDLSTQLPSFPHMNPLLPYHAIKIKWTDIIGKENILFRLVDINGKEIITSSLASSPKPVNETFQNPFKALDFKFITPAVRVTSYQDWINQYAKYRDPWLLIITEPSQLKDFPRSATDYYDEMVNTDFDKYFLVMLFSGIRNEMRDPSVAAVPPYDPGIDIIFQNSSGITIINTYFERNGPIFYFEPQLQYAIAKVNKNSLLQRGNITFEIRTEDFHKELLQRFSYEIP